METQQTAKPFKCFRSEKSRAFIHNWVVRHIKNPRQSFSSDKISWFLYLCMQLSSLALVLYVLWHFLHINGSLRAVFLNFFLPCLPYAIIVLCFKFSLIIFYIFIGKILQVIFKNKCIHWWNFPCCRAHKDLLTPGNLLMPLG